MSRPVRPRFTGPSARPLAVRARFVSAILAATMIATTVTPAHASDDPVPDVGAVVETADSASTPTPTPEATPSVSPAPEASPRVEANAAPEAPAVSTSPASFSVEATDADVETAAEPGPVVLDGGRVDLASRIVDGDLRVDLETDGRNLDPAGTVFVVRDAEAWPGEAEGQDPAFWSEVSSERTPIWRTPTPSTPGTGPSLVVNASGVDPAALLVPTNTVEATVRSWLVSASGPATTGLLGDGTYDLGTSQRSGRSIPVAQTYPQPESAFGPAQLPIAAAFAAEGTYCVTIGTHAQLADGTFVNHDVTLTFAVGAVDIATVSPCAQPAAIPPQEPQPRPSTATGVTVVSSGTALLATTLHEGSLSLDAVVDDRGRTTSYDPSEVVFSLPHRDTRWPATGYRATQQDIWARHLAPEERAYRTLGRFIAPGTAPSERDEWSNDLTLDLEARFVDGASLAPDSGVDYSFLGATSTAQTGRFFAYWQSGPLVPSPDAIGFWSTRAPQEAVPQWRAVSSADAPFYARDKQDAGLEALGTAFTEPGVYCVTLESSTTLVNGAPVSDRATFTFAVGVDAAAVKPCAQDSGAATIVREGDVRVAARVTDGDLVQELVAGDTVLDPARTVFALPTSEQRPDSADGQGSAFWDEVAPQGGAIWRSRTPENAGNALSFALDTSGIPSTALYDPEWAPEQAVLRTWLGSVLGSRGGLLTDGATDAGTSSRAGDAAPRLRTRVGEGTEPRPLSVAFGEAGRACVTLDNHAQLADGTFVNHDLTLTFAVGVDPETVEPCAQPAAIAPQAPHPITSTATGTTVLDSGTVLMAPTLADGALTLNAVTMDRGRTTAFDPARVVLSVPNRDAQWPADGGTANDKEIWERYLPEGSTAYRTSGRFVPDDRRLGDEHANDLVVDLDARFVSADDLRVVPDEGATVAFDFGGTTNASGRFFTYRQDYSRHLDGPENIGFWDSAPGRSG